PLAAPESTQDVVHQIATRRAPDPDPYPRELRGTQRRDDRLQTSVTSRGAPRPNPDLPNRQVGIVVDYEQIRRRKRVPVDEWRDRSPTEIHEREGLDESDRLVCDLSLSHPGTVQVRLDRDPVAAGQPVNDHESNVVARA